MNNLKVTVNGIDSVVWAHTAVWFGYPTCDCQKHIDEVTGRIKRDPSRKPSEEQQTGYQRRMMRAAMARKSDRVRTNVRNEARTLKRREASGYRY